MIERGEKRKRSRLIERDGKRDEQRERWRLSEGEGEMEIDKEGESVRERLTGLGQGRKRWR